MFVIHLSRNGGEMKIRILLLVLLLVNRLEHNTQRIEFLIEI